MADKRIEAVVGGANREHVRVYSSCGKKGLVVGGPTAEPWGWWMVRKVPRLEDAMWRGMTGLPADAPTVAFCSIACILNWALRSREGAPDPEQERGRRDGGQADPGGGRA